MLSKPASVEGDTMKRFHVHVHVDDLQASIAFYTKLFAADPERVEGDYAAGSGGKPVDIAAKIASSCC